MPLLHVPHNLFRRHKDGQEHDPRQEGKEHLQRSDDAPARSAPDAAELNGLSALNAYVLLLAGGCVVAVACAIRTCAVKDACVGQSTCIALEDSVCGFRNRVTAATDTMYDYDVSAKDALSSLLRDVCAPGERMSLSVLTGKAECIPYFTFPSALNEEIMDPSADTPHMRACGKWIEAGGVVLDVEQRAWEDNHKWKEALEKIEEYATASSRSASNAMSKFRAECERTVHAGVTAMRSAAMLAYQYLSKPIDDATDRAGLMRASGHLMGHFCASSVYLGSSLNAQGTFQIGLGEGWMFSSGTMAHALHLVDESVQMQDEAEVASYSIRDAVGSPGGMSALESDIVELLIGATGGYEMGPHVPDPLPQLFILGELARLFDDNPDHARSYLRGVAAFCSFALISNADSTLDFARAQSLLNEENAAIRRERPAAVALGRLSTPLDEDALDDVNGTAFNASTITFSHLATSAGHGSNAGINNKNGCLQFMRRIFPDSVDQARFDATISQELYERLGKLYLNVQHSVARMATWSPFSNVLSDPYRVASGIKDATMRIAGAPRGASSWAGIARPLPEAAIASSDGVFVQALKQANAVAKDRMIELSVKRGDPCDHPPFYEATTTNAYMMYNLGCSVILLGMAHRPWMDAQFNDASLLSRGLAVAAHELSHITLRTGVDWDPNQLNDLLRSYRAQTYTEAIADVMGVFALVDTGLVSRDEVVMQWCQSWCARLPFGYAPNPRAIHPYSNERCDALHDTVMRYL
mgnify:CR=1 FL=1|tara:strand:+ start:3530 stop:5797 length:2268 start_codon:yes stop_codon:yes gene_type:complete